MLTCVIKYHIDPTKKKAFAEYARNWGQSIPRCGADLIGYFAPHEGSSTLAYGIYNIASLSEYEVYRTRLATDVLGRQNYEFAQKEKFILREDRTFLKLVSAPHTKGET
ncbi:NIPSNAP family protein [Parasulfitobacter algicola]|uniref:NIPSNAP family protein n=1 Tax=Parasulfitobacter algicola TaxID=2614809 RepID=A0ABX2IST3_9RHOB|nr:NIPSNAP family protein [Sulfitobacter algicola]NSX55952.1 NIPSNAP family protein [Sulfitobacter algicola]